VSSHVREYEPSHASFAYKNWAIKRREKTTFQTREREFISAFDRVTGISRIEGPSTISRNEDIVSIINFTKAEEAQFLSAERERERERGGEMKKNYHISSHRAFDQSEIYQRRK